ncbi:MAG: spore coat protein CotH, partial [Firmicutes bacterium]|nr:spore coat protein CotH [Bacillota bacterium]
GQSLLDDSSTNSATPSEPSSSQSAEEGGLGAGFGSWGGGGFGSMGSEDVKLQYIDDDPDSYANIFDNAKTDITTADKTRLIESLRKLSAGEDIEQIVDIEAVIKYFVVHTFVCNDDSYTGSMVHNYYLYEENRQLSMIPWDYNLAFGGMGTMGGMSGTDNATTEVNSPIDSPVSNGDIESRPMIAWIFDSEEYTELYHQYYQQFISDYFDSGYFSEMLNSTLELISTYVAQDPTAFCSYDEFVTAVDTLKEFCLLRAESVSQQLAGTIPSTEEGQQADNSSLIDASHLSLSAMGEFSNGGKAGENMTPPGDGFMPDELNSGNDSSSAPAAPPGNFSEQTTASDAAQTATDTEATEGLRDDTANSSTAPQQSKHPQRTSASPANNTAGTGASIFTGAWFWLAISILVLIIGLIIAIRFKR